MIYSAAFLKLMTMKTYLVTTLSFLLQSYWVRLNNVIPIPRSPLTLLIGNVFIFLLAGHEVYSIAYRDIYWLTIVKTKTATHTLAFTFGLLALYPDEQEKLFQHIKEVLADGRSPVGRLALELFTLLMVHV